MGTLDKGMTHVQGRREWKGARLHVAQKGMQFKAYKYFISGIFHFIFSNYG